ncbi:hypothetical protein FA95DRAFT_983427 [Auriscalpium vulgare]|uniref:Uncharacterized protein n=1 Tax=Auriscalpium vulgare TaxID=40419 RepID=A0ACB8R7E2_9AGAM|nr:hypothetical protein FA95DRAFT_983427 [Auriscalpium vulgare]
MSFHPDTPERRLLSLTMSQIISPDAPLSSPISPSDPWDTLDLDTFSMPYQAPSPPYSDHSVASVLKAESYAGAADPQLCVATNQLFDMPPMSPTSPPSSPLLHRFNSSADLLLSPGAPAVKRPSSPTPSTSNAAKKLRGAAGISTKDFVPPDVTGLSKREARLVKNRAAAFLSRQRKREEFELMEVRVAELEQENARLLALATNLPTPPASRQSPSREEEERLRSEVESLRAQLAAVSQRETALASHLLQSPQLQSPTLRRPVIKTEPMSPPRFQNQVVKSDARNESRTSASLSLLVLLCALPSIFSVSAQAQAQPGIPLHGHASFPLSHHPVNPFSSVDFGHSFPMGDYDWRTPANAVDMDFDMDGDARHSPTRMHAPSRFGPRKLEFVDTGVGAGLGLDGLDVSFDAEPAADGKIRVRIYTPSSPSSSSSPVSMSPTLSTASTPSLGSSASSAAGSLPYSFDWTLPAQPPADPFLGIGSPQQHPHRSHARSLSELSIGMGLDASAMDFSSAFAPGGALGQAFGSAAPVQPSAGSRKRVRIAMRSMPQAGGGGEWEVEVC